MPQFRISTKDDKVILWRVTNEILNSSPAVPALRRVGALKPHGLLYNSPDAARSHKLFADKQWGVHDFGRGVFVVVSERGCETWLLITK